MPHVEIYDTKLKTLFFLFMILTISSLLYKKSGGDVFCLSYAIIKILPISVLWILSHEFRKQTFNISIPRKERAQYLKNGLFFSACGDVLLIWPQTLEPGIIAFAVAHFYYIKYFNPTFSFRLWTTAPFFVASSVIWTQVFRNNDDLTFLDILPVAYSCILISMLWQSLNQIQLRTDKANLLWDVLGAVGGILFFISDLCIAITMFVSDYSFLNMLIMPLYYFAQLCITLNIFK